ncbi:MAG: hypothetical protein DIU80_000945 [Chloroflexota bacterium]|nr:MAG: hypothetical protein DIU80_18285 [Chloroflexota bacterium]
MTATEEPDQPQRYTFLLSLWRESATAPWRATLRAADDEARKGFATIEHLVAFLREVTAEHSPPED